MKYLKNEKDKIEKIEKINFIIGILMCSIVLIFCIMGAFFNVDLLPDISEGTINNILYIVGFIIFIILIIMLIPRMFRFIRKIKNRFKWRRVKKDETDNLQELYKNICANVSKDLEIKGNRIRKKEYKKRVINLFIKSINSNMEYCDNEQRYVSIKRNYIEANFDNVHIQQLIIKRLKNFFTGIIDDIYMEMIEIFAIKHYHRIRGTLFTGGPRSLLKNLFRGMFITLYTNKEYERFEIRTNNLRVFNKKGRVKINNQKFNKYFRVFADKNANIKNFLTNNLIEFLTEFRERYNIDFEIIFEDKIYIRFYTTNLFEPKLKGKIVDEYSVYQFYVITKFVKELVAKLNIN